MQIDASKADEPTQKTHMKLSAQLGIFFEPKPRCSHHIVRLAAKWHECKTAFYYILFFVKYTGMNIGSFELQSMRVVDCSTHQIDGLDRIYWNRYKSIKSNEPIWIFVTTAFTSNLRCDGCSASKAVYLANNAMQSTHVSLNLNNVWDWDFNFSFRLCRAALSSRWLLSTECVICLISNYIVFQMAVISITVWRE